MLHCYVRLPSIGAATVRELLSQGAYATPLAAPLRSQAGKHQHNYCSLLTLILRQLLDELWVLSSQEEQEEIQQHGRIDEAVAGAAEQARRIAERHIDRMREKVVHQDREIGTQQGSDERNRG